MENNIIRIPETEILKSKRGKIPQFNPIVSDKYVENALKPSLLISEENKVVPGLYEDSNNTLVNVSLRSNQAAFGTLNSLRNASVSYLNIISGDTTNLIEKIPVQTHVRENLANMQRMANEYPEKAAMLDFLIDELFDTAYAINMHMVGRSNQVQLTQTNGTTGRISTADRILSGYIKVEGAPINISINLFLRGVPVPMRRTLTSVNRTASPVTYNYVFTHPQYLLNNLEIIESISHAEVTNYGSATFWYGDDYSFTVTDTLGFENKVANLNIVNYNGRNFL
jgi:hypothetical protein